MFADLHRHLDGSMRRATLAELLGREPPADLAFRAGMGLAAALEKFALTLSALRTAEAVRRVAGEICEDAAGEGVTTLEIRFAPQLHTGTTIEEAIDAAVEGAAGRAGIVLCGLYGEPPDLVERLVRAAIPRKGVVGMDLAGGPAPGASWGLEDYAPAFALAERHGIGRTVHAGEGRPPAEIRTAIERLHAQRIGHGTTLLDDPQVVDLVLARGVTIEACPTSNVHTGAIPRLEAHPLSRWLALGVRACINTDNTLLSAVTSPEEHARARTLPGMTDALLTRAIAQGHDARFRRQL